MLLPVLLAFAAVSAPATDVAGHYRVTDVHELASELELAPDGRFRWALSYGALDEHAQGRWTSDAAGIRLTTDQPVRPAIFAATTATRIPDKVLRIAVAGPDGNGLALVDIVVEFDTGEPATGYTQSYGWSLDLPPGRRVTAVRLGLPAYGVDFTSFPVDTARANDLGFRFIPNDFGTRDFRDTPLLIGADGALSLTIGNAPLRYQRQKPR